jgi:ribokinase
VTHPSRLFCLDTVMIDIVLKISSIPERGSDVLATEHIVTAGGGYNAMSAAARQDMSVFYAGRLGTGPYSNIARVALERDHIARPIESNGDIDNGFCVVLLEDGGERTFITSRGSEATLRASDLAALDVQPGDCVLVSGYNIMDRGAGEIVLRWLAQLVLSWRSIQVIESWISQPSFSRRFWRAPTGCYAMSRKRRSCRERSHPSEVQQNC